MFLRRHMKEQGFTSVPRNYLLVYMSSRESSYHKVTIKQKGRDKAMKPIRLAVVGGSSYYTPALIEVLNETDLEVDLVLNGRSEEKLSDVAKVCRNLAKPSVRISTSTDLRESLAGADFILQQVRIGGMRMRAEDERFPFELGIIGEETIVPGGASLAARTIPYLKEFAGAVREVAPKARVLVLTNPNNMVIDYLNRYEGINAVGFCDLPTSLLKGVVQAITGSAGDIETVWRDLSFKYYGINHLAFLGDVKYRGETVDIVEIAPKLGLDPKLIETLELLPVSYLRYYYYTSTVLEEARKKPTRGELLYEVELDLAKQYRESQGEKPEALGRRQVPWYRDVVVRYINACREEGKAILVTTNQGAIPDLRDDQIAELPVNVVRGEVQRIHQGKLPLQIRGLITSVADSERLIVDAVAQESANLFRQGLIAHPLVREVDKAQRVMERIKEINDLNWL